MKEVRTQTLYLPVDKPGLCFLLLGDAQQRDQ